MSKQDGGFESHGDSRPSSPPPRYGENQPDQYPAQPQHSYYPPQQGPGYPNPTLQYHSNYPLPGQHPAMYQQQPAPPINNVVVNAPAPAPQPIIVNNVVSGGGGNSSVCPSCGSNLISVQEENSCATHLCCLLLCVTLPFCFFLPYCCNWCKRPVHRCGRCRTKLA